MVVKNFLILEAMSHDSERSVQTFASVSVSKLGVSRATRELIQINERPCAEAQLIAQPLAISVRRTWIL